MEFSKAEKDFINSVVAITAEEEKTVLNVLKGIYTISILKNLLNKKEIVFPFIGKLEVELEKYMVRGEIKKKVKVKNFNSSDIFLNDLVTVEQGGETQAKKWFKESIRKTINGKLEID